MSLLEGSFLDAVQRISKEVTDKGGFDHRVTSSLRSAIHPGQEFAFVNIGAHGRAEIIFGFKVMRQVMPGNIHLGIYCVPDHNPDSRIIVAPDVSFVKG